MFQMLRTMPDVLEPSGCRPRLSGNTRRSRRGRLGQRDEDVLPGARYDDFILGCSTAAPLKSAAQTVFGPVAIAEQVSILETDTNTRTCAAEDRLAALSLGGGAAFWRAFPNAGTAPELEGVTTPLVAIVYTSGWPGIVLGVPGADKSTPAPGTRDVCVETVDGSQAIGGQSFIVYGNIPTAASVLESH